MDILRIAAAVILTIVAIIVLGNWAFLIIGIIVLLWLIRILADWYWKGKDKDWW